MASTSSPTAQIIPAPSRPPLIHKTSIFLAGTTSSLPGGGPDWRTTLTTALSHLPITIFNPLRPDWDSSWREDISFAPFREQVEWELDMQERADVVVVYFGPGTDAPISLLELGLCVRGGKAVVACHGGYKKRGNVEIVCGRFGVEVLGGGEELVEAVVRRVAGLLRGDASTRGLGSHWGLGR